MKEGTQLSQEEMDPRNIEFAQQSPGWEIDGVKPSDDFMKEGFKEGYKPPADFFNWFWTRVSRCVTELQGALRGYAGANELDKAADRTRWRKSNVVYRESSQSATARKVMDIDGVESWSDLADLPLHVQAAAAGTAGAVTFTVGDLAPLSIHFPDMATGELTATAPEGWVRKRGVYVLALDMSGTAPCLVCTNPNGTAAGTTRAGVVQLVDNRTTADSGKAPTAKALKELNDVVAALKLETLKAAFPVGCYYMTSVNTNPAGHLGFGTWALDLQGRSPFGFNASDTDFAHGKTGGAKAVALTAAQLAAHSHGIPALGGTAATNGVHKHTYSSTSGAGGAHKHTYSATSSTIPNHQHSVYGNTGSVDAHAHTTLINKGAAYSVSGGGNAFWAADPNGAQATGNAGKHGHSINFTSGGGGHSHTVSGTSSDAGGHTHTVTTKAGTSGNAGSGGSHNNLPPYKTVYFWRRTA